MNWLLYSVAGIMLAAGTNLENGLAKWFAIGVTILIVWGTRWRQRKREKDRHDALEMLRRRDPPPSAYRPS